MARNDIHVYGLTLTMKEEIFCKEYSVDFNAKRAAEVAGYAKNRAAQTGYDLLQKPKIQQRLEKVKENLAEESGISALMVLNELKKIAFSNTADYFDGWMKIKDFNKIPDEQKAALADIKVTKKTYGKVTEEFVQFKMHDKLKALEDINKMLGFNKPEESKQEIKVENIPLINWVDALGSDE